MRVLVVTVVHHPEDARILHRQIRSLREAGHAVTYAAPFRSTSSAPPGGMATLDLPRASGRRRVPALRAARHLLRAEGPRHDVVLLHDPELLAAAGGLHLACVVWDVHEDTAAAVTLKPWLPPLLRPPARRLVGALEHWAEGHVHVMLAEEGYQERFARQHPVVPNSSPVPTSVPPPGPDRVVYVGAVTRARGAEDVVELGRRLHPHGVRVEVMGPADASVGPLLRAAHQAGDVDWRGFVPNDRATRALEGAMAGLSLLHDEPNYRHSRPTKVIEYMARGIPVVSTPLPAARALVEGSGSGVLVPFQDPAAASDAVLALRDDPERRVRLGAAGHQAALDQHNWDVDGPQFVALLERWAGPLAGARRPRPV